MLDGASNIVGFQQVGCVCPPCWTMLDNVGKEKMLDEDFELDQKLHPTFKRWKHVGCLLYTFAHDIQHFHPTFSISLFQIRVSVFVYLLTL